MSLTGALNVGLTGLAVAQAQIQTTGNNISNANTPGYTRQVAGQAALPTQQLAPGIFVGTGVTLTGVQQQIDQALESRLRSATSDNQAAQTSEQWLGQVQSTLNALSGDDIGAKLSDFYTSWSNLANTPQDAGLRQTAIQAGSTLASNFQDVRGQLVSLQGTAGDQFKALTGQADSLAQQVADLNGQIVVAQGGPTGSANGLLDHRSAVLTQLSQLVNITTTTQTNGAVNVYVGSEPLVSGAQNNGITYKQVSDPTKPGEPPTLIPIFKADGGTLAVTGGQLGALGSAEQQINGAIDNIDALAKNVIFEVNKIHASGQGLDGFTTVTAANAATDPTVALNNPQSGLKFTPNNGSFVVHVKSQSTGLETSTLVQVDLNGSPSDTTLNSLKASLSAIGGVNASITAGKLTIAAADPDTQITFSQDTSGTLAALGINNYFTGSSARNIAVSQTIQDDPSLLAAAKNGQPADNQTAIAIAALSTQKLASLNGASLSDNYQSIVNGIAGATAAAKTNAESSQSIVSTLQGQRDAISGVSIDEEAVNLMKQQRAYQAAARVISTVDQMMQTLLAIT